MMDTADIIIPFVDGSDPQWRYYYSLYNNGKTLSLQRFRDPGILRYQLRSIERNLPWIRNVFLVVASESQIPRWLDVDAPSLKIIYHEDYIPKNLLPTFNSNIISLFYSRIKNLGERFIVSNDDIVFLKQQPITNYFRNGKTVGKVRILTTHYKQQDSKIFSSIKNNVVQKFNAWMNTGKHISYANYHLAVPHLKSKWKNIWDNHYDELISSVQNSRLRNPRNVNTWLFNYIQQYDGTMINDDKIDTSGYYGVSDDTKLEELQKVIRSSTVACFNDTLNRKLFWWDTLNSLLEDEFPNKSVFEL